ncbi:MAG TPA: hypothetical protein VFP32_00960 [Candidatus Saccharimonadales bacterium]|nr:hypothetical protein [Candidatus Saccharimonadales bacterium]
MEFMSRGDNRSSAPAPQPAPRPTHSRRGGDWQGRAIRIEWFIFTALVAIVLLVAIGWLIFANSSSTSESDQIKSDKYQAVFLNGGATSGSVAYTTYFGHISKLNNNYFVLKDIYYLTTSNSTDQSQATPQLTKLGCQQLHSPYDEMVINRSQVAFWENLQDNGKVVQAIKQFQQQNPNGPNCNASSSNNAPSSTQNSTSTQQSTTPNNSTGSSTGTH